MDQQKVEALKTELELLRQDNVALLEALRLAQLGGVDLQGHLSKFNPDAAEQGIFTQDWELRYFVLSGSLLKYYTSERDVGRQYRGVLSLQDCIVEVEEPASVKGPFIFQINDPDGDTLLRLSADKLDTAKTWIKTLHAVGLRVRGFRRLTAVTLPGWQPQQDAAAAQQQGFSSSFASFGRALSGKWSSLTVPPNIPAAGDSIDSELSIRFNQPPHGLHHADLQQQQQQQQMHSGEAAAAAAAAVAAGRDSSSSGWCREGAEETPVRPRPSVGPPAAQVQRPGRHDVMFDEDDVISLGDDSGQMTHLARLRQKCRTRWAKCRLSTRRERRRHAYNDAVAGAMPASAPGAIGGAGGAPADGSSSGSSAAASQAGMAAAAAAAAAPGYQNMSSSRHRRTSSAPLQKQVSWRWERLDVGDELPAADLSDEDSSSDITSSSSTTGEPQVYAHPHLDSLSPQQQQLLDGARLDAYSQQQQQQALHSGHLEGIQEQEDEFPKRPQRISAFGEATEAATIAAAGGISAAVPDAAAGLTDASAAAGGAAAAAVAAAAGGAAAAAAAGGAGAIRGPPTPPPMVSAGPSAAVRSSGFKPAMGAIKPQGTGVVKPKKGPMVGYSPVHVAAKDSILTEHDRHGVLRHEGFLNLGVVVLLATNIRMIIGNLMTYGLRMRVNRAVLQSVLPLPLSRDDVITLVAIPGSCVLFALGALLVEWLGLRMLLAQEKLLRGLQKKGVRQDDLAKQGAGISSRHERLLLLLNLLNAGGSLVIPCCLVLSNQASLVPAFMLTAVSIVNSMKLATYAHCNTTLRREARTRAVAAAAAGWPVPATTALPVSFTFGSGSGSGGFWGQNKASLIAPAGLATAATHTAVAAAAANGSSDVTALRSSATDPSPFVAAALRRTSSLSRRQVAAGVLMKDVVYPGNLNAADLAYFLAAPTLTYQLNFPKLRQRRWRLLSRWLLLAVLTAIAMSFMQVQFLMPCMQSSLVPLRELNYLRFMERLLRLAVPNTGVWLAMFYLVFHLWLNILGELLLFGDRMFYKEWWNAATLADYWKLWNLPVHKWMLRTIFFPLVRRGAPRLASLLFVFFISAVMHELAVGVPLRMLRGWAFWGMMMQVPLITLTELLRKRLKADTLGNMVFWASFCVLGQPMCLVLYYHDWLLANLGEQGWRAVAAQGEDAAARMASGSFNSTLSSVAGSPVY